MMNCMFNEKNPSDHPAIIKITRPGNEPVFVATELHYFSDEARLTVLREMDKYLKKRICFKQGMVVEAINVMPRDVKNYLDRGILPEGMHVCCNNMFLREYYAIMGRKVTSVSRMEV